MRPRGPLAAILLGLACLVPAAPTLGGEPGVSLNMEIGACSYGAETSRIPDDTLTVVHRSAEGALKAKHTFDVSVAGFVVECPNPRVRTGDRIELRIGTAKTLLRTFTGWDRWPGGWLARAGGRGGWPAGAEFCGRGGVAGPGRGGLPGASGSPPTGGNRPRRVLIPGSVHDLH